MNLNLVTSQEYENQRSSLANLLTPSYEILGRFEITADGKKFFGERAIVYASQGRLGAYVGGQPVLQSALVSPEEKVELRQELRQTPTMNLGTKQTISGAVRYDPEIVLFSETEKYIPNVKDAEIKMV